MTHGGEGEGLKVGRVVLLSLAGVAEAVRRVERARERTRPVLLALLDCAAQAAAQVSSCLLAPWTPRLQWVAAGAGARWGSGRARLLAQSSR